MYTVHDVHFINIYMYIYVYIHIYGKWYTDGIWRWDANDIISFLLCCHRICWDFMVAQTSKVKPTTYCHWYLSREFFILMTEDSVITAITAFIINTSSVEYRLGNIKLSYLNIEMAKVIAIFPRVRQCLRKVSSMFLMTEQRKEPRHHQACCWQAMSEYSTFCPRKVNNLDNRCRLCVRSYWSVLGKAQSN